MTRYYLNIEDDLATQLEEIGGDAIIRALKSLVDDEAPPADEIDHEELSAAERKRRRLRRIRRNGTSFDDKPVFDD